MANEIILGQHLDALSTMKIINLPNGTAPGDSVNFSQLSAFVGGAVFQGSYDSDLNSPNLTTPLPGVIDKGFYYKVTVAGTAFFGEPLEIGDTIWANVDNPASLSDWTITQANITVPVYVTDYYVATNNVSSDSNSGLSEFVPFATLDAALLAAETAGVKCAIHILDDDEYEISTQTMTVDFTIFHPVGTIKGAGGGAILRHGSHSIEGYQVIGDDLTFTSNVLGTNSTHNWKRIINPNLLYTNAGGDPEFANYTVFVNELKSAAGTGDVCDLQRKARFRILGIQSAHIYAGGTQSPYKISGTDSDVFIHFHNADIAGAATGNLVTVRSGAMSWVKTHCSSVSNILDVDGAGSEGFAFTTNAGGDPNTYIATGGGVVRYQSMVDGFDFSTLNATAGLDLTDLINIHDVGTGRQVQATLTQLQTLVTAGFVTIATVQTITGAKTFTSALTVQEGTGSGLAADAMADDLVVTGSGANIGMSIMAIAGGNGNIFFGETGNADDAGRLQFIGSVNEMRLNSGGNYIRLLSNGYLRSSLANYETLIVDDDAFVNKKYVDDSITAGYPQTITRTTGAHAGADKQFILCDTSGGNITINLPAAASNLNAHISIKKTDAANTVTIDGNLAETIDGALTAVLNSQWEMITVVCDGSNWFIGN